LNGQHTWSEIQSQGAVWQAAVKHASEASGPLADCFRSKGYTEAIFIGCGSTHYLSLSAAALASDMLGLRSRGLPSSEVFLFPREVLPRSGHPVLVAVSRSGETSETIMAVEVFKKAFGNETITVGNYPDARLVKACDASIIVPEGQEVSVAQTRSFASMVVALQVLIGTCAADQRYLDGVATLPEAVARVLKDYTEPMKALGADRAYDKYVFLGSGPFFGIASEGMLKMKEMSLAHSEAFHYMEFRHGPKSIVDKKTLIIAQGDD
jgi:glutamine---fructose-6-phosphate transaminase (isomerizing)